MRKTALALMVLGLSCTGGASLRADQLEDGLSAYSSSDYQQAALLVRPVAEAGNKEAQYVLGVMYDRGNGVPQDMVAAASWYARSANQGHALAQYNLGAMYCEGLGVAFDPIQAYKWLNLASANLSVGDQRDLAVRYRDRARRKITREQLAEAQRQSQAVQAMVARNAPITLAPR
ncbi:MAG: tetratricopeptide repeat protein [Rhodospirillaceae bacterium]